MVRRSGVLPEFLQLSLFRNCSPSHTIVFLREEGSNLSGGWESTEEDRKRDSPDVVVYPSIPVGEPSGSYPFGGSGPSIEGPLVSPRLLNLPSEIPQNLFGPQSGVSPLTSAGLILGPSL